MVRCYICETQFKRDDEVFFCRHCGCYCHQRCMEEYKAEACPKCVGEPMIGAVEF